MDQANGRRKSVAKVGGSIATTKALEIDQSGENPDGSTNPLRIGIKELHSSKRFSRNALDDRKNDKHATPPGVSFPCCFRKQTDEPKTATHYQKHGHTAREGAETVVESNTNSTRQMCRWRQSTRGCRARSTSSCCSS